ncbi:MAG: 4-(cytidine 5'-diphospho)-2-C-methyl-D-erythritol kinase [Oscillospiraceae bacterium]|nr:4-(cytidine 5'-diphospho)-2-C-methyl-D-erythritol kinase [Oscillospiraceae bacterium]
MTEKAYAKINLFLDITGRRPDGYHEISSVMHTVSLCDDVSVAASDGITIECDAPYVPCDERNIAYKCAAAFFADTGIKGGVHIAIRKRIPSQAGLGGGSADGAAVLRALDRIYCTGLSHERLCSIAAMCGADIPFCISGGCAYCGGIGEIMTPLPAKKGAVVIAKGSDGISTGRAYEKTDALGIRGHIGREAVISAFSEGIQESLMYNFFEEVADNEDVVKIKRILSLKSSKVMMTGSGSAVFGIFGDADTASDISQRLGAEGYFSGAYELIG